MNNYINKLREKGFKLTPQRMAIASYMDGNKDHPTAAQVFEALKPQYPSLSQATVYNSLSSMVQMGSLKEYRFHENQVHYDPDISAHHHFCCKQCRMVLDVPQLAPVYDDKAFQKVTGHQVDHVSVVLHGLCESCQNTKQ